MKRKISDAARNKRQNRKYPALKNADILPAGLPTNKFKPLISMKVKKSLQTSIIVSVNGTVYSCLFSYYLQIFKLKFRSKSSNFRWLLHDRANQEQPADNSFKHQLHAPRRQVLTVALVSGEAAPGRVDPLHRGPRLRPGPPHGPRQALPPGRDHRGQPRGSRLSRVQQR